MSIIEEKTANAILQKPMKINIGNREFQVAHATTATLIQVSSLISKLPTLELDRNKIIYESLMIAKDCKIIGLVVATLILGEKKHKDTLLLFNWIRIKKRKDKYQELSDFILYNLSPKELDKLIVKLLKTMELEDFFDLTTSLIEINLLRRTR